MHPALAPVGDGVGRPRRLRLLGYPIRSDLSIGGARVVTVMRT
jgi:hypothetical protein